VAVSEVRTMEDVMAQSVSAPRATTSLFAIFAVLALLLGLIGIYSVVSQAVAERTREIGVRMAIGAQRGDVLRLILAQGMRPAAAGIVIGLFAAVAASRVMASLLYGTAAIDGVTYAAVTVFLAAVAALACFIPARRATRVDPVIALRDE
ncbi:MAG TPA: FtsX-like permease family protein, partial [Candidatus Acidoferrales bacterium]|nr:FtsX-like permease family protein [Candidatus Acidoferrales bacterium]